MLIPCALLLTSASLSSDPTSGKKLVFDQNFQRQKSIDQKVWFFDAGPVYNHEMESYAKGPGANAYLGKDGLVIEARKEGGKVTSARMETVKSWKYGYYECEALVPQGRGTWPAFWMLNEKLRHGQSKWPLCGEVDIMENVGFDGSKFHFSLHSDKYNFMKHDQRTFILDSDSKKFHRFGALWSPDAITFYLDRKPVHTFEATDKSVASWPFTEPFYIILNLAIGGDWGGAKGVDDKIFPSRYVIRNVRIYQ